jgi:outer membrane lipoprotein-sorting protein
MRSSVRWLVPVAVAATVAGGVAVSSAQAGSAPDLPQRTPQQVLASVAGSSVTALSGTVVTRADLGLPSLSALGGTGADATTDPTGLITRFLSGQNTLRVWADGPTKARAQLLDQFSELDVVRNGTDVWTYTSHGNAVQHGTLTPRTGSDAKAKATATAAAALTPAQMADKAIAAADPTTSVTLGTPETVAGRSAYALTLTPKTSGTLVGHIVIAVDAERGVPLQVQVFARGSSQPAVETGFTAVDFTTPAASMFTFTPPKGATVTPLDTSKSATAKPATPAADKRTVIGTGWTSIVEIPASALQSAAASAGSTPSDGATPSTSASGTGITRSAQGLAALAQLATPVANGGHAITTSLVSVLLTQDGRVFAGSVPVQALVDAAAAAK